jgi:hypothetical protein
VVVKVTVGAAVGCPVTVIITDRDTKAVLPVHVRVNVVVTRRSARTSDPDVAFGPDHPPLASHRRTRDVVHVSVDPPPATTSAGAADNVSVGGGGMAQAWSGRTSSNSAVAGTFTTCSTYRPM